MSNEIKIQISFEKTGLSPITGEFLINHHFAPVYLLGTTRLSFIRLTELDRLYIHT